MFHGYFPQAYHNHGMQTWGVYLAVANTYVNEVGFLICLEVGNMFSSSTGHAWQWRICLVVPHDMFGGDAYVWW